VNQHTPEHEDCYACAKEAQDRPLAARDAEIARLRAALEAVPCDGRCWPDAHEGRDVLRFGPSPDCPKTKAAHAATPTKPETP
jgi:hypothetical protein